MASSVDVIEKQSPIGKRERQWRELVGGKEERITRAACRVCHDQIVETTVYHPSSSWNGVMGPGSSSFSPAWEERRYHCQGCGIKYEFVREETEQ